MAPQHHSPGVVGLLQVFLGFQNAVNPARYGYAFLVHHGSGFAILVPHGKTPLEPIKVLFPDASPMSPGASGQPIVAGQGIGQYTQVSGALNVVVATEDVGAAASSAHVAQCQLQHTVGAGVVVAVGVLGTTHAPDDRARAVIRQGTSDALKLCSRHTGYTLDFLRVPFLYFLPDVVHAVHAGADELLVFPAVLKDVPQQAPDQRDV